ncbi:MAG: single-stranded-DNA-specific exonuclease RecJ [Candidatus Omnitrophica bacterium]|nr:single-stranded-DNA-specific exonuclease RecJ [Candidatus Omnitrophota bacterium]
MTAKRWHLAEADPALQRTLAEALDLSLPAAQILINRRLTTVDAARAFLRGSADGAQGLRLPDLEAAVARLHQARRRGEQVVIVGDYDVDGITGTALLTAVLRELGCRVTAYLPNRLQDGYGLGASALAFARAQRATLVVTVDCGTTAIEAVAALAADGIDTVIVDHHTPLDRLPPARAIVNPVRRDSAYPTGLASVGVAFRLAEALVEDPVSLRHHLDLVALGTVADVMPLSGENRQLVKQGLEELSASRKQGLRALLTISGLEGKPLSTFHLGFILCPRINAVGRLGSPDDVLRLLLTESADEAQALAVRLEQANRERQRIESRVLSEAMAVAERTLHFREAQAVVVAGEGWHPGVLGIVAARLVERFYRPALVISFEGEVGRGSGRSIRGFHLVEALRECEALLESFGGHAQACGLTLQRRQLEPLRERLNRAAAARLQAADLQPVLEIDVELPLSAVDERLVGHVASFEPFGPGNAKPLCLTRGLALKAEPQIVGRQHLKCWLTDGRRTAEAIGFGMGHWLEVVRRGPQLDCVYTPTHNDWDGERSIQLELKDVRSSGP